MIMIMAMKVTKMRKKMIMTIISSIDIEGIRIVFVLYIFFYERYFKYEKHKQKHFK